MTTYEGRLPGAPVDLGQLVVYATLTYSRVDGTRAGPRVTHLGPVLFPARSQRVPLHLSDPPPRPVDHDK